ncbi:FliO/MopB family protein [Treponema sp.]|uniref:FliO/MopB family protein n=1 Tax=Treponema sp. TaxID=166 RepID=UPI003FA1BE1D
MIRPEFYGWGTITNTSKKYLTFFLFLAAVVLFLVPSFLYAQTETAASVQNAPVPGTPVQGTSSQGTPVPGTLALSSEAEKSFVIGAGGSDTLSDTSGVPNAQNRAGLPDDGGTGASTLWLFIRMILVLALVIAGIYALVFFLKKGLYPKTPDNPFLKKAVSLSLGPGKSIHAVTMPGAAWLVGVSEAGVNLIAEITDKELIDALILEAEKTPAEKPKDFAQIFAAFSGTAKQTEALLKKQRSRLGGE